MATEIVLGSFINHIQPKNEMIVIFHGKFDLVSYQLIESHIRGLIHKHLLKIHVRNIAYSRKGKNCHYIF